MLSDLRYALRGLLRTPAFTAAAVLSLALGIGANTAIFSVASALLLRPLSYAEAERLVILWNRSPGLGIAEDWFSTAQYFDIKTSARSFDAVGLAIGGNENLTGDGEPERIGTIHVSSSLLPMLGVRPALGRLFDPPEDAPGPAQTALLGHGTWMRRFGGDPKVLGRSLVINGRSYRIVGVLPASFSLPREVMPTLNGAENAEILLPLPLAQDAAAIRMREDYNILARLAPGATAAQSQAEMDTLTARLRRDLPAVYPPNGGLTCGVVPLQEQVVGDVRRPLAVLVGAVAFVLLIACANVANLLLARALARRQEIAVRGALGASRSRILRLLLVESLLIALAGGAAGLLLAGQAVRAIRFLGAASVPRLHEIAIDGRVLAFTLVVSMSSGVLFGLAPALRLGALDIHTTLKDAARGAAGAGALWGRGGNVRRALVALELALSVILLIGAGLLVRSFAQLQRVPPGFNPAGVLTFELTMSGRRYDDVWAGLAAYKELWRRLAELPGVTSSGAVSALPLSQMFAWGPITVEGRQPQPGEAFINVDMRFVAGDYFAAMEIPLRRGRLFDDRDIRENPRVAIVDELMARTLWPNVDPVGRRFRMGADPKAPWHTVVGVVGRVKQYALDAESRSATYFPHAQYPTRAMNVVLRTRGDPAALASAATRAVSGVAPDLPVYNVRTMDDRVAGSLARRRFSMLLMTLSATLAMGLAAIGTYGVMAYLVNQGTRELGIRIALGATPRRILVLVVRQGMAMAAVGVTLGLCGALVFSRFVEGLLFGVGATDARTFVVVALFLCAVALFASYVPARRAAGVDPLVSLRSE